MKTPFLPYGRQTIEADDIAAVTRVLTSDALTSGPEVDAFEAELAERVGARAAVAVSNGTAALQAACFALDVGPGDEVVVPAVTFLATASCVLMQGAEPIFADVDPDTGLLSADAVAARITPRTRAVLPVHLNGATTDTRAIARVAEEAGAAVVEDAAHALGAREADAPIGSGRNGAVLSTFSFHPVKAITTGEGGAVTSNDEALLRRVARFRNHAMERDPAHLERPAPGPWYYEQQALAPNLRLSDIHAALGRSQLTKLDRFIARRRSLAAHYDERLAATDGVRPVVTPGHREACAYHLYPVLIDYEALGIDRAELMAGLRRDGIATQVHYMPLPGQPLYRRRGWRVDDFPGARRYAERVLSLPLFPGMRDADVDRVVDSLSENLSKLTPHLRPEERRFG